MRDDIVCKSIVRPRWFLVLGMYILSTISQSPLRRDVIWHFEGTIK